MLIRQFYRQKKIYNLQCLYALRNFSQQANEELVVNQEVRLSPHCVQDKRRKPFVKDLFLGKFDPELMSYPQTESYLRYDDFNNWFKTVEDYIKDCCERNEKLDKKKVLYDIQHLDVLKACIGEEYYGFELSEMETLKLVETLSNIPWLGTYFVKNYLTPLRVMNKYSSDDQKLKYYRKIINGELILTMCLHEQDDATNAREIKTRAVMNSDGSWVLNGRKTFVVNGMDSNFFLAFAHCVEEDKDVTPKTLSLFLVERDFGGITCSDLQETVGARDTSMCTVNFNNTVVPKENVIGEGGTAFEILLELITPGQQDMAGYAITTLRNFIKELMLFVVDAKHMNKNLYEIDAMKHILSRVSSALYNMESIAYLTSGIIDNFHKQDVKLEKAISETYCANECVRTIFEGLQVIGPRNYLKKYPFMKMFEDSLALTLFDGYNIDGNVYIASLGLQHSGNDMLEHVKKIRNFTAHPVYILTHNLFKKPRRLFVNESLHPSLEIGANVFELNIFDLNSTVKCLFERYGTEVMDRHMDLYRLSEIVTLMYVSAAALGRASRAYCIGLRNSEDERDLAVSSVYVTRERIKTLVREIKDGEYANGDHLNKKVASCIYQNVGYPFAHPTDKVF